MRLRATYDLRALVLLSLIGCVGCGKLVGKKEDASEGGVTTSASTAAKPAPPGACSLGVPGGTVATGLDGDLDRFSIGVGENGGAMLSMDLGVKKKDPTEPDASKEKVFWVSQRAYVPSLVGSDIEKGVKFARAPASLNEAMGQESAGSALSMGDVAYSATFGQGESPSNPVWKYGYVIAPHNGAIWSSWRRETTNATQLASAGRKGFGIIAAVSKLLDRNRNALDEEPKVIGRVVELVTLDGKTTHPHEIMRSLAPKEFPEAPAAAVSAAHAAISWKTPDKVMLALVGTDGKVIGATHEIGSGDVGAPALAFKGETLYAVWGERALAPSTDYVMHYVAWDTANAAPPAKKPIPGTGSAYAPGLASTGSTLVLAWMEGDDKTGAIRLGSTSSANLEDATKNVQSISTPGVNARDPEVGFAGDKGMIGWTEFPKGKPKGELRVSNVTCPSP
jgi:hypothetical protein